jgi:hypothetical protein
MYGLLFWLEDVFPPSIVPLVVLACFMLGAFYVLKWITTLIFNPRAYQNYDYGSYGGPGNDDVLLRSTMVAQSQTVPVAPPPRESFSINNNNNNAFFSPGSQAGFQSPPPAFTNGKSRTPGTAASEFQPAEQNLYDESIYNSPPLITPSRNGEGVRRRNPYTS